MLRVRTSSSAFSKVAVRRLSPDFHCGAASLATGKLEDCAAHQAARSAAWRGAASRSLRKLVEAHIACTHRGGLAGTSTLSLLNGGSRSQGQALGHRPVERCTRYTIRSSSCLIRHHPAAVLERARGTVRSPAREIRETTRDGANHAGAHGTHLTRADHAEAVKRSFFMMPQRWRE